MPSRALHLGNPGSHARDRGGNDIKVEFFHDRTNLHSVWDTALIRHALKRVPTTRSGRTPVRRLYAWRLAGNPTPQQRAAWSKQLDPIQWANESYRLSLDHAYDIPKNGQLGQEYFELNIPVVEDRLTAAGVRLAGVLNATFDE